MEKTRVLVTEVYLLDLNSKEEKRVAEDTVIGRSDCDLNFPNDTLISRRHLRLSPAENAVIIEDLGSTNNTLVNGKFLKPNTRYKLRSRDVIQFGQQKCQIIIGGKLAQEPTLNKSMKGEQKTAVFSRLVASPEEAEPKKKASGREEGLEDFGAESMIPTFEEHELAIQKAVLAGSSWYLQFDGSEFGPLGLGEMRAVVKSENFQGGDLFVWAEGLPSWILIDRNHKLLQSKKDEAPVQDLSLPVALVAMVYWTKAGADAKKKASGTCDNISIQEISVSTTEKIANDVPFEVEVAPRAGVGIERFRMMVKLISAKNRKAGYTFQIVSMPPKTKQVLARYIKEQADK